MKSSILRFKLEINNIFLSHYRYEVFLQVLGIWVWSIYEEEMNNIEKIEESPLKFKFPNSAAWETDEIVQSIWTWDSHSFPNTKQFPLFMENDFI